MDQSREEPCRGHELFTRSTRREHCFCRPGGGSIRILMGMWSRRRFLNALIAVGVSLIPRSLRAQAGSFLTLDEAPQAVFPEGTSVEQRRVLSTPQLREAVMAELGPTKPS